jgi:hypothetical protein
MEEEKIPKEVIVVLHSGRKITFTMAGNKDRIFNERTIKNLQEKGMVKELKKMY